MTARLRFVPAVVLLLLAASLGLVFVARPASPTALQDAGAWVQPLLVSAIGIGWVTMAAIELIKPQFRGYYHQRLLQRFGVRNISDRYLLEQPIERLTAQLQAWGEFALRHPEWSERESIGAVLAGDPSLPPQSRSHLLQRRLDTLQLHAQSEWRTCLRLTAIGMSSALSLGGILLLGNLSGGPVVVAALVIAAGVIGGHFASVARDIVATVERRR
jgi:hypothetical protein